MEKAERKRQGRFRAEDEGYGNGVRNPEKTNRSGRRRADAACSKERKNKHEEEQKCLPEERCKRMNEQNQLLNEEQEKLSDEDMEDWSFRDDYSRDKKVKWENLRETDGFNQARCYCEHTTIIEKIEAPGKEFDLNWETTR
ncbi:hypothetical protein TNCV_3611251 [Trichonephila clavipes]|nr:hypothetical protein TNCV_3611251 [Trichonephila clavipes]